MDLFDLVAKITLDSSEYEKGLGTASEKAKGFGEKLQSAMKVGGAAIAAVATATTALTGTIIAATGKTAEYGDNIDKMSQKMGLSAQAYQEWDAIMQHSGTSMETMKAGMKTLANAVENGNEAFQRIGLTQEQIASMSQEDLFAATISGLQKVDNETERTYLAGQLLGRGATELGALLNTSAEDTEAMRKRVHELGGVMSDDAVKAAAHYQDSLQDMQTAFGGLQRNMISKFLPSITTVMDGLGNLFSGNGGLDQIKDGISGFASKISEELPKFVKVGGEILNALIDAIAENLPTLIETGADFIVTLALGVVNAIPTLIEKAPEIIMALVRAIINAAPQLLDAAVRIVVTLAEGIGNQLSKVVQKGREIVSNVGQGIRSAISQAANWGKELISNFINGIVNAWNALKDKVGGVAGKIAGFFKHSVPKDGAFKRDDLWGAHMIENFTDGMMKKAPSLIDKAYGIADSVGSAMRFDVQPSFGSTSTRSADSGLAAEIAALRADVRNMKIYLDTGVLVGTVNNGIGADYTAVKRRALA